MDQDGLFTLSCRLRQVAWLDPLLFLTLGICILPLGRSRWWPGRGDTLRLAVVTIHWLILLHSTFTSVELLQGDKIAAPSNPDRNHHASTEFRTSLSFCSIWQHAFLIAYDQRVAFLLGEVRKPQPEPVGQVLDCASRTALANNCSSWLWHANF